MVVLVVLFWLSLAALAWTHVLYPLAAIGLARVAPRPVHDADVEPTVAVIVAAYNEESVIARRLENLLALDYPPDRIRIVVSSDASDDRTEAIALEFPGVKVISNPRGGKVAAQDRAVRQTESEIVAFTDANSTWDSDALRRLVRPFADPDVAYACGQLHIVGSDGANQEGVYWRYELGVRDAESRLGSVTGGNGSIYAVRRSDYVEVDPRFGHDLALPYLMVQHGRRAVYEPAAAAHEKATPTNETEYRRKVRMFEHCWLIVARGRMLRRLGPRYGVAVFSHRHLRYASGILHVVLLATSLALIAHGFIYDLVLAVQLGLLARCGLGCRDRALLRPHHVGHARRALELRATRRPCDVGGGGGHTVNRVLDVAIAGTGLVVTSPALAIAALAVKLEDGGPVLYRQTRVGRDGADFELLKLRTMVVGAEKLGAGYAVDRGDDRITRAGRILRRLSLDELPQLWNVVRGEMSVIGPRPTLRYQVERYDERQLHRLDVKPGITGWAQIHGRASLPWSERIELDLWYVQHRDWKTDLLILLRTPLALFGGTYKGETGGWQGGNHRPTN